MSKKYIVAPGRQVLGEGGIVFPAFADVPYDKALFEIGAIVEAAEASKPAEPPKEVDPLNPAGLTEDEETITNPLDHLNAEDAIALAEMTTDRNELGGYLESEKSGKNRKSVVHAIEKQLASLN